MNNYSRVCAKIDMDVIAYNMEQMRQNIQPGTGIIAVVKADGYGHGAVPVARMLEEYEYVWGCATATLDEAVLLRKEGIRKPILVLGCVFPDQYEELINKDISLTVYQEETMQELSALAESLGKTVRIHIKLETGMGRLGFSDTQESIEMIERIISLPGISAEGIFSHFSKADEADKSYSEQQMKIYDRIVADLERRGISFPYHHISNSAGIIDLPQANKDLVRAGIAIYGMYPSEEVLKANISLRPSMSLISHVEFVKPVKKGSLISYGGTYEAPADIIAATVPVGYADGYPRSLSNKGYVLIRGRKAPIIGKVCMDQFMVDVTGIEGVRFGDEVVLVGQSEGEYLPVEVLSDLSGRFNYEFVCDLSKRIPRVYIRNGKVIEQIDYFA